MTEHQYAQQPKKTDNISQKQTILPKQTPFSHPAAIIQRARINPKSLTHADVMQLQRTIGNRAVGKLLSEIGLIPSKTAQTPPLQMQTIPEEEEPLQGKMAEVIQRQEIPEEEEPLQGKFAEPIQFQEIPEEEETLQGKFESIQRQEIPEEEEPLQGKFENNPEQETCPSCSTLPIQRKKENHTGMPDNLKAGVENLSGIDMSDVRVHYNSDKPSNVGALAYTQGTDIHVAPGQEQHLPHEAWHVVQQAQGRVRPTMQARGLAINDDVGLEQEAEVMGAKTTQIPNPTIGGDLPNQSELAKKSLDFPMQLAPVQFGKIHLGGNPRGRGGRSKYVSSPHKIFRGKPPQSDWRRSTGEHYSKLSEKKGINSIPNIRKNQAKEKILEKLEYVKKYDEDKKQNTARITLGLRKLLLWGVSHAAEADLISEKGMISVVQVENTVDALLAMSEEDYTKIKPVTHGGTYDEKVRAITVLKAIAARKDKFYEKDKTASEEILKFSDAIRKMDAAKIQKMTTLRNLTQKDPGLRQRFINTCGQAALQVLMGELDPIYAFERRDEVDDPEWNLEEVSRIAAEQLDLKGESFDKMPPPIRVYNIYLLLKTIYKINPLEELKTTIEYIESKTEKKDIAISLLKKFQLEDAEELLADMRRFYPFESQGTGTNNELEMRNLNEAAISKSSETYDEDSYGNTGDKEYQPGREMMEKVMNSLIKGKNVALGIRYGKGTQITGLDEGKVKSHAVLLVDIKSSKNGYLFLLYEPTTGTSNWISEMDFLKNTIKFPGSPDAEISHIAY